MEPEVGAAVLALRERGPGHAVIHALLCQQGMLRSRGRLARLFGVSPLSDQGLSWYRGALGEIAVGRMLSKLGSGWMVMHGVPVGRRGSDVDHVVVGAAGVFTVNSKNHSGQRVWVMDRNVMVAGQRCDHVRNGEFEASRVAKMLDAALGWPVQVRSIVAVLDPASLDVKQRPDGVEVVEARKLVRWLKKRPAVVTDEQLARVKAVIGTPMTWGYRGDSEADLDRRRQFDALQAEIKEAKRIRMAWAAVLIVTVICTALVAWSQATG